MPEPTATASTMPTRTPPDIGGSSPPLPPKNESPPPGGSSSGPTPGGAAPPPSRRKKRSRRTAPTQTETAAKPAPVTPLSDDEVHNLGVLQLAAAKAGRTVEEYVDDHRALIASWDRLQAVIAAEPKSQ